MNWTFDFLPSCSSFRLRWASSQRIMLLLVVFFVSLTCDIEPQSSKPQDQQKGKRRKKRSARRLHKTKLQLRGTSKRETTLIPIRARRRLQRSDTSSGGGNNTRRPPGSGLRAPGFKQNATETWSRTGGIFISLFPAPGSYSPCPLPPGPCHADTMPCS